VEEARAQIDTKKPENYGFASMAAVPYAHTVAQMLHRKNPKGTTITLAPNPKDIVSRYSQTPSLTKLVVDLEQFDQRRSSTCKLADDRLVPHRRSVFLQYHSFTLHLRSRQPRLHLRIRGLFGTMGG
jgi:hypothetical protein